MGRPVISAMARRNCATAVSSVAQVSPHGIPMPRAQSRRSRGILLRGPANSTSSQRRRWPGSSTGTARSGWSASASSSRDSLRLGLAPGWRGPVHPVLVSAFAYPDERVPNVSSRSARMSLSVVSVTRFLSSAALGRRRRYLRSVVRRSDRPSIRFIQPGQFPVARRAGVADHLRFDQPGHVVVLHGEDGGGIGHEHVPGLLVQRDAPLRIESRRRPDRAARRAPGCSSRPACRCTHPGNRSATMNHSARIRCSPNQSHVLRTAARSRQATSMRASSLLLRDESDGQLDAEHLAEQLVEPLRLDRSP